MQWQRAWDCHGQSRLRSHTLAGPPQSKLPPYFDLALKEVHTEARVDSAWKHLPAGDHMELFNEAMALNAESRLFDTVPKAPLKTAEAAVLKRVPTMRWMLVEQDE